FLVMEFAEGKSLSDLGLEIKQGLRSKPSLRELITLASGLLEGLHALHDVGIILGDLSVRTVRVRTDWQPRITRYRYATIRGKAPELLVGPAITVETDLQALGTLLFELADKEKFDVWRQDRTRTTGLDTEAASHGPFHAFIDALIGRQYKDVEAARE